MPSDWRRISYQSGFKPISIGCWATTRRHDEPRSTRRARRSEGSVAIDTPSCSCPSCLCGSNAYPTARHTPGTGRSSGSPHQGRWYPSAAADAPTDASRLCAFAFKSDLAPSSPPRICASRLTQQHAKSGIMNQYRSIKHSNPPVIKIRKALLCR